MAGNSKKKQKKSQRKNQVKKDNFKKKYGIRECRVILERMSTNSKHLILSPFLASPTGKNYLAIDE